MPTNLGYEELTLYFNIAFFAIIGLGFLIGYIRGFRKSLYSFIVTLIFYALFFATIEAVVNQLWITPLPFAFEPLAGVLPELAGVQTIGEAVFELLESYLGETLGDTMTNVQFVAFVTGIAQFVVKLVYTILYFTVGQLIYKILMGIIRLLFFSKNAQMDAHKQAKRQVRKMKLKKRDIKRMKKEVRMEWKKMSRKERKARDKELRKFRKKKRNKKEVFDNRELLDNLNKPSRQPLMGALFGAAKGAVSAYITLILLGGMMSMMGSLLTVLPEDDTTVTRETIEQIYLMNDPMYVVDSEPSLQPLASPFDVPPELESQLDMARNMVDAFNDNLFVQNASSLTYNGEEYGAPVEMHLYLFDTVLSFNFNEERIMLRNELDVMGDTAAVLMDSEFIDTNDIADIQATEIVALFDTISQSKLITNILPLGIEIGSEMYETDIEVPVDELYEIDWESELQTLGAVAAVGFELINTAGILNDETDLTTVTIDGTDVRDLFDSLADSELVTLGAYVAVEPLLSEAGGNISAIITVPTDLDWGDEFRAFGEVAESVLNTGITVGDLESGDPTILIGALADLDFTVLLNSKIVTNALVNVFSGQAGIEGLDMIVVPDGIDWNDLFDDDGNLVNPGELRNILEAFNAITDVAGGFDLENLDLQLIADFDEETIDTIFASQVLVATISTFLLDMDLGDTPLLIPDSVLDEDGYITATELKAVANSARVLVTDLACDEGDTVCEETGFDIAKAFDLSDTSIDTLTTSDIIGATVGNLIIDSGGDILTVPPSALSTISVDDVDQDVVSKQEIKRVFQAVGVLGFTDLDNMAFDASIIQNLGLAADPTTLDTDKSDKLFASKIVHATLSDMLFEQATGETAVLNVPFYASDNTTEIRVFSTEDQITYISLDELESVLQALLSLDISDFANVDSLDLGLLLDNIDSLLESAILHATISEQVIDLSTDTISLPYVDADTNLIRFRVGDILAGTDTEYIAKTEITAVLDAMEVLGITEDINSFDGNVDIASITAEEGNIAILLASATIHATISDQLLTLVSDGTLSVPYVAANDTDVIRATVGNPGKQTEYIAKTEIQAMIDALEVLGITEDINTFDGNVDIASITSDPANIATLLASATIHATISDQLLQLEDDGTLAVPYVKSDGVTDVRVTVGPVGSETEYITKSEIEAMVDALEVLGITEDINTFDGNVDIASITSTPGNLDTLLLSATIHATISDQLLQLDTDGTLAVPFLAEDDATEIRVTVGPVGFETEYITTDEISAMVDALEVLGITDDINSFDGNVDIASITSTEGNIDILLSSATIQATISDQLFQLDTDGTLAVPYFAEDGTTEIRITVGDALAGTDTEYILATEISAMVDALEVLGITEDINTFDGNVDIASITSEEGNLAILLASATIQATISDQLLQLDVDGTLAVPFFAEDGTTEIRITVGDALAGTDTEYILSTEITAMVDALEVLGITEDINTFDGNVDIASITSEDGNIDILLASATIQATISDQLLQLDVDGTLAVPFFADDDSTEIRVTVGDALAGTDTEYIIAVEITALVDSLEVLGITDDINTFDGNVDIASITSTEGNIDILLASSTIQATISQQLIDLDIAGTISLPFVEEDGLTAVRISVGDALAGTDTEYITGDEITALVDALEVLGITDDINTFDGNVDIATVTSQPGNVDILLTSSTIQATISEQLIELDVAGTLDVPFLADDGTTDIRVTVGPGGSETEYVVKTEISALVDALDILGLTTGFDTFDGSVDIASITAEPGNTAIMLASASIQATMSKQIVDLDVAGTVVLPFLEEDNATAVRITVGSGATETEYVSKTELEDIINALDVLGITSDVNSFDGSVDLSVLATGSNSTIVLSSSMIQATVSEQVIDLETTIVTTEFVVPYLADNDTTEVRFTVGSGATETEYVLAAELDAMIDGLNILGITNVETFDGSIDLTNFFDETNRNTLLTSSIMQATISAQLIDLGDSVLRVPVQSISAVNVRVEVGDALSGTDTEYVTKDEIGAMFEALEVLGFSDINDFSGTIDLNNVYGETNQNIILASASMHATISKQIFDLAPVTIQIPTTDIDGISIQATVSGTNFLTADEIKGMINALEVLGVDNITTFDGTFSLASLSTGAAQDTLLSSASIHLTVTNNLTGFDDSVLIVPAYKQAGETPGNEIKLTVSGSEFVIKDEIKYLIDAFNILGFSDIGGATEISLSGFFTSSDDLLLSASIQATVSDKMLNGTGGSLIVPDTNVNDATTIRIVQTDVTYIEVDEIKATLDGLEAMGLTDFGSLSFNPATIFLADFNVVLASASLQATISDNILDPLTSGDETEAYGTTKLLVPTFFREDITVASASSKHIEKTELFNLLTALDTLGVSDFGGLSGSAVTSMTDADLDTLLTSGSMHTTIDNMLRGNGALSFPTLAEADPDPDYQTNILTKVELKAFIKATNTVTTGGSFTSVSFDLTLMSGLSTAQREIVVASMIVRDTLTPSIETIEAAALITPDPSDEYGITATDYMNDDTGTFLTYDDILLILEHYYPAP